MANNGTGFVETELTGNRDIDGILWGFRWASPDLTYSFPAGTAEYQGYEAVSGFEAFNANQRAAVNVAIANFNAVCGLNIALTTLPAANLRFAEADTIDYSTLEEDTPHGPGGANNSAGANVPGEPGHREHAWGDMWFTHNNYENPQLGSFAYAAAVAHEIGHALGLAHGHATQTITHSGHEHIKPRLPADHDSQEYSIMTYRRYPDGPTIGAGSRDYPQSLMQNDIAALQYLYGADFKTLNGNTIYSWNTGTGAMSIDGIEGTTPVRNRVFLTIWDGGGIDTYDFSNYGTDLAVDLNPGAWTLLDTSTDRRQLARLGNDDGTEHFARGHIANALQFQGDVRSLIENATGGSGDDSIVGNAAANVLDGGLGADTLTGNGGDDTLIGNAQADTLVGSQGNDRFEGGRGGDAMLGGAGIDQAQYTFATSGVTASLLLPAANLGDAAGDTYDSVENLRGTAFDDKLYGDFGNNTLGGGAGGNDLLEGNAGNDTLNGGVGDDTLDGGAGRDLFDGGTGNDIYYVQEAVDGVFEAANAGRDTVRSTVRWVLDPNFEVLELLGTANINGFGNELNNAITGNDGNNYLDGGLGFDRLNGGSGNDTFALGELTFTGAAGGFRYDTVSEAEDGGIDTVNVASLDDPDTAFGTDGYTLDANVENGVIVGMLEFNLTGNALDNRLTGNSAFNVLRGGDGGDTFVLTGLSRLGNAGSWIYDSVIDNGTTGADTVVVTAVDNPDTITSVETYGLGSAIENGVIAGSVAFNLTGNALGNELTGNSAVNVLTGGEGDDTYVLTSLAQLNGAGLWIYDTIVENGVDDIDTVIVSAVDNPDTVFGAETYTLGAAIENGTIAGNLAFNLTGNASGNDLIGNQGNNRLIGLAGQDNLAGGDGNDTLIGGEDHDNLRGGGGNDRYVFNAVSEAVIDYIIGFGNAAGDDDSIAFSRSAFLGNGAQLALGTLDAGNFVVRDTDNLAQDADDYFIFSVADMSLWYDPTGSSVADDQVYVAELLGDSSLLSSADIVII